MITRSRPLLALLVLAAVAACGRFAGPGARAEPADVVGPQPRAPEAASAADSAAAIGSPLERRIVRSGELDFRVDDAETARRTVIAHTTAAGGYVARDTLQTAGSQLLLAMKVCVPAGAFDGFLEQVRALGHLDHQQVGAEDVTAKIVDLEARLGVLRDMQKRFRELIARAGNVADVLTVERELAKVLAESEAMESQLHALGEQVAMSELDLRCRAPRPADVGGEPRFADAFLAGWDGLVKGLVGAAYLWPLWGIAALVVAAARVRRRGRPLVAG
ncbi:MAG: DUF4349 domain-containing protein [Planctomycetota bacterium]